MHIVDDMPKIPIILYKTGMVSTLKQMPMLGAKAIKPRGQGTLQPMHTLSQVRLRRFEQDMVVITHHHIGMAFPTVGQRGLLQDADKRLGRVRTFEDIPAVVASVHHMVERTLVLNPEFPCHAINRSSSNVTLASQNQQYSP